MLQSYYKNPINPETGEIRSGQIAGNKGFDYCILKFGDYERSSAELEMAYYKMAMVAGINMMPCRIIEVEGQKHFITHRFDREKLLMVCRKMRLPESTQEEVFRRMVLCLLVETFFVR